MQSNNHFDYLHFFDKASFLSRFSLSESVSTDRFLSWNIFAQSSLLCLANSDSSHLFLFMYSLLFRSLFCLSQSFSFNRFALWNSLFFKSLTLWVKFTFLGEPLFTNSVNWTGTISNKLECSASENCITTAMPLGSGIPTTLRPCGSIR